jgi:uncharacterized membrane protein
VADDLNERLSAIESRLSAIEGRLGLSPTPRPRPAVPDAAAQPSAAFPPGTPGTAAAPRRTRFPAGLSESALGEIWLARAGMAVMLTGLLLLAKYSWDAGWLGPEARVLTIFAISAAMLGAGEAAMRRPPMRRYGALLTGGGICGSFFATWAAHRLFGLVGIGTAAAGYLAGTAAGLLLSLRYGRQSPAFLGLVGGIATPLLLSAGKPRTLELFAYLAALSASALWAALPRGWRPTLGGTLAGAIFLYAGWWEPLHGPRAVAGFAWHAAGAFLLLAVAFNGVAAFREPEGGRWRALFAFASLALSWALALALEADGSTLQAAIPPAGLSVLLLALSALPALDAENRRRYAALSLAAVLLVPLTQFTERRFALVLGIEGLALAFAARETGDRLLGRMARLALFWALADAACFLPWLDSPFRPWRLLLNERFAVAAAVSSCAAWSAARLPDDPVSGAGRGLDRGALLAAAFALVVGALSFEANDAAHRLFSFRQPAFAAAVAVTFVWTSCALAAVAWGFRRTHAGARWTGLALFAATLLKVFLFDLGHVGAFYRVVSFLALGGVLLAVAWGYNRIAGKTGRRGEPS